MTKLFAQVAVAHPAEQPSAAQSRRLAVEDTGGAPRRPPALPASVGAQDTVLAAHGLEVLGNGFEYTSMILVLFALRDNLYEVQRPEPGNRR